jgi:hypothetical protein
MGGPCEAKITGSTKDEMMENGMKHVRSMDDKAHQAVLSGMDTMSQVEADEWQRMFDLVWDKAPDK